MPTDSTRVLGAVPEDSSKVLDMEEKVNKEVEEITVTASPWGGVAAIQQRLKIPEELDLSTVPEVVEVKVHVNARGSVLKTTLITPIENNDLTETIVNAIMQTRFRTALRGNTPVDSWVTLSIPLSSLVIKK